MSETIDEITITWHDEAGQEIIQELKKEVLTRGSWSTIVFLYKERDKKSGQFGNPKIRVARFQKRNGKFMQQSKFNVSSAAQAKQLIEIFQKWLPEMDDNSGDSAGE